MHVIITCKYEKDLIKNSREKVATAIFGPSRAGNSVVRGRIWPNFELIQALMCVIVTCKYEKDPSNQLRKSGKTVFPIISQWGFFSDAKGLLAPQSVVESRRISNSSELSCMALLPASMKRIG